MFGISSGPEANGSDCQTVRHLVRGRVQGVGFRAWAARRALELGIRGWVRNRADGSVELVATAPAARLERLQAVLREGPPLARVDGVETGPAADPGGSGFEIR